MRPLHIATIIISAAVLTPCWAAEEKATFAGGCFWCMEPPFDKMPGVKSTTVGYSGGKTADPTYPQVSGGNTGHAEVVQIVFNPEKVSYKELLDIFWRNIDPTTANAQFCDKGSQYRAEIFYHNAEQKKQAEESKKILAAKKIFKKPIVTQVSAAQTFYRAETYHQDYYIKNPLKYKFYRYHCGRDKFLNKHWGHNKEQTSIAKRQLVKQTN